MALTMVSFMLSTTQNNCLRVFEILLKIKEKAHVDQLAMCMCVCFGLFCFVLFCFVLFCFVLCLVLFVLFDIVQLCFLIFTIYMMSNTH